MRRANVPVTMGSPRFRTAATTGCTVTDAWFPPDAVLEPHTHERTIFAVMLDGSFDSAIGRRRLARKSTRTTSAAPAHACWSSSRTPRGTISSRRSLR
jgi:hypothetical protein